jgi:hypothetical protein
MFPVVPAQSQFPPCPQSEQDCEGYYLVMPDRRVRGAVLKSAQIERTRKQKHLAFLDLYITKYLIVYDTKEHLSLVLIEPFLSTTKMKMWCL